MLLAEGLRRVPALASDGFKAAALGAIGRRWGGVPGCRHDQSPAPYVAAVVAGGVPARDLCRVRSRDGSGVRAVDAALRAMVVAAVGWCHDVQLQKEKRSG